VVHTKKAHTVISGKARLLREVEILARMHTRLAIDTLAAIVSNEGAPEAARVNAAKTLLDRGWGKAPQTVEVSLGVEEMADGDLDRQIAQRIAGIVQAAGGSAGGPRAAGDAVGAATTEGPNKPPRVVH
jgi:hypothetical protein